MANHPADHRRKKTGTFAGNAPKTRLLARDGEKLRAAT